MPVQSPSEKFNAVKDGKRYWINPSSYKRYDTLINLLTSTNPEQLANTIHDFRPLFDLAFSDQRSDDKDFGSATLIAINELLATPVYQQAPELTLESIHFKYKDAVIEKVGAAQKQLIRSGPDNTRKIQRYLQQLHAALPSKE